MSGEELKQYVLEKAEGLIEVDLVENTSPQCVLVAADQLVALMTLLHRDEQLYFDSLSCLTGVDLGPDIGRMEVVYNLYSIPFDAHLMVKVVLEREKPSVPSLTSIWKAADWHEREAYDLLGINFEGHPDLRRILMPADWQGFPLRKDYKEQEYYRGVKVKF